MLKIHSLIKKRREINRQKGLAGARAKDRKRLEAPAPAYPIDRDHDYQEITIKGMHFGQYREITYILLPVQSGQGRCDQYALYRGMGDYIGMMGRDRAMREIGQREFVTVRAMD